MASFDVKSLFTNIPIKETCNTILDKLFPHNDVIFEGLTHDLFSKILDNCTNDNILLIDKQLYVQRDGARMSGCISPTLANIFLARYDENWLNNCFLEFKPIMLRLLYFSPIE